MPVYLLLALSMGISQDTTQPPHFGSDKLQRADSIAAAEFSKDSLGSITIAVVSGPDVVWAKSYGYSDSARTRLATPNTIYRIASVTKQFTALMLLQLVERRLVALSDPVERFFPELRNIRGKPEASPPITFAQLATMTSGLSRDPDDRRITQSGLPDRWVDVLLAALATTKYADAPGVRYRYSNIGYAILGEALARIAGESYINYQHRHIIAPLGMSSTAFALSPAMAERLAVGVDWDELVQGNLNYADAARGHRSGLGYAVPSGGLYSTVHDLGKLVSLQLGFGPVNLIKSETVKIRDAVPIAADQALDYGYGLGFQAMRWGDTVAIGHSGNLAGYTSMVLYDPAGKFGVIVLRSAGGGEADAARLAGRVFRSLRRSPVK